ncbi:hypothetical protein ACDI97_10675 [Xanthomonas axonopodis pv. fascicularis]|uniref:hypothetical protein n=1 Tax=Xanthomonas axonopodis TaxID=53413 RepID=UPI003530BB8B
MVTRIIRKALKFVSAHIVNLNRWVSGFGLIGRLLCFSVLALGVFFIIFVIKPDEKVFTILVNLFILSGILLVASGAVISHELRARLYDIRQGKDARGITDAELAELITDTSDNCEAGTLVIVIGTVILVAHSVI